MVGAYSSWQEVQWLYNNGFEISDHSATHPNSLNVESCSGLNSEIYQSRKLLAQNGISFDPGFALPDGVGYNNASLLSYIYASGFSHVYPDGQDQSTAVLNYNNGPRTYWYELDAANYESFTYFRSAVSQASGSFVVGLYMHLVTDHVSGSMYYINTTNFRQDMAYLANNGYTVILPS